MSSKIKLTNTPTVYPPNKHKHWAPGILEHVKQKHVLEYVFYILFIVTIVEIYSKL